MPGIHGDVFNVHMGSYLSGHTVFFSVSHHTTTPHTPHRPHTTPRHKTQHQTETDRDRDRGRRGDEREDDKTRAERREKSGEREIHFQCGGAWPFFYWCCDFPVNSVCARDLSLLNSVKYDSSVISFSVLCPVNSFSKFLRIIFSMQCQCHFFFLIFLLMQLQF